MVWGAAPLSVPRAGIPDRQCRADGRHPLPDLSLRADRLRAGGRRPALVHRREDPHRHAAARRRLECADGLGARRRHPQAVHDRLRLRHDAGRPLPARWRRRSSRSSPAWATPSSSSPSSSSSSAASARSAAPSSRRLIVGLVDTLGRSFDERPAAPVHERSFGAGDGRGPVLDADLPLDGGGAVRAAGRPAAGARGGHERSRATDSRGHHASRRPRRARQGAARRPSCSCCWRWCRSPSRSVCRPALARLY